MTDTDGRLLTVKVHSAAIQDRDGGKAVLKASRARYPFVTRAFADGGYGGQLVRWAKDKAHIVVEVVKRSPAAKGFEVLRRRWVVERTFAWILKNRRFVRDYEQLTAVAEPSSSSLPPQPSSGDGHEQQPSQTRSQVDEIMFRPLTAELAPGRPERPCATPSSIFCWHRQAGLMSSLP